MHNTSNKKRKKTDFAILGREPMIRSPVGHYVQIKEHYTCTSCASCFCCIGFTGFVCTSGAALRCGGLLHKSHNIISPDISKKMNVVGQISGMLKVLLQLVRKIQMTENSIHKYNIEFNIILINGISYRLYFSHVLTSFFICLK